MCRPKKKKDASQELRDDYIAYGSEYHSIRSKTHRDLYQNLLEKQEIAQQEKCELLIGQIEGQALEKKKSKGCTLDNPITQTTVDAVIMIVSITIILIMDKHLFGGKDGSTSKTRQYFLNVFGDRSIQENQVVYQCQNQHLGICQFKAGHETAGKMYYLLMTQIFKPFFVLIIRWWRRELNNNALFTHSIFVTRLFYDIGIFLLNYEYMSNVSNIYSAQYLFNLVPIFLEIPLYIFSVMPAHKRTYNVRYRQIRTKIKTHTQNDEMWSTDPDTELDDLLKEQEMGENQENQNEIVYKDSSDGDGSSEGKEADQILFGEHDIGRRKTRSNSNFSKSMTTDRRLSLSDQINSSSIRQEKDNKCFNCCSKAVEDIGPKIGPFEVFIKKRYKPAFICMMDLIVAISFFIGTNLWFTSQLTNEPTKFEISYFFEKYIPLGIWFLVLMNFLKVIVNQKFLQWNFITPKKLRNSSKSVNKLFLMRIFFDLTVLELYTLFFKENETGDLIQEFKVFFIYSPIILVEFLIYNISVEPAKDRVIYQQVSIQRFRDKRLTWLKEGDNPNKEYQKIDKFIDKMKRNIDNKEKVKLIKANDKEKEYVDDNIHSQRRMLDEEQLYDKASYFMAPIIWCSKCMAIFIILLNIVATPLGTLVAIFVDSRKAINKNILCVFLIQCAIYSLAYMTSPIKNKEDMKDHKDKEKSEFTLSLTLFIINKIWAIVHSIMIYSFNSNRILLEECNHLLFQQKIASGQM